MNNYKYYDGVAYDFFTEVFSRKKDMVLKTAINHIKEDVKVLYRNYDENFDRNTLGLLTRKGYQDDICTHLENLYKYSAKAFVNLRTELTTTGTGRMVVCQYCTLNKVNTFDHFVPKVEFSEFAIHPRNLLCCCSECNSKKNNKWRDGSKVLFLNLYKDILPENQYLFVKIKDSKTFSVSFYLENKFGVDANLFELIQNHYEGLNLFERFAENADSVVSSFLSDLKAFDEFPLTPRSIEIARKQIGSERAAKGINYWESVLKLALLDNMDFLNLIK